MKQLELKVFDNFADVILSAAFFGHYEITCMCAAGNDGSRFKYRLWVPGEPGQGGVPDHRLDQ